jgi:hypothetical protein
MIAALVPHVHPSRRLRDGNPRAGTRLGRAPSADRRASRSRPTHFSRSLSKIAVLSRFTASLALGATLIGTATTALVDSARAQQGAARGVAPSGSVRGVELGLEGARTAMRGDPLRWLVVVHDVIGLSDLRPSPGARIRVTTAVAPTVPIEVVTDARGRATVEVPVPADAPASFGVVIEVFSRAGAQRRFELSVDTIDPRRLELGAAPTVVAPGGLVHALGRFRHRASGKPYAGARVALELRDRLGRPVGNPTVVETDAAGLYATALRLPRRAPQNVRLVARVDGVGRQPAMTTSLSLTVARMPQPPLLLAVAPDRAVVRPGDTVTLDVVVRTPDGRPLAGAQVRLPTQREAEGTLAEAVRTDARGRARLTWRTPTSTAPLQDAETTVEAAREGLGTATTRVGVRLARVEFAGALAVEGGALPEALGGRVWVRVVRADGTAAPAGVPVVLRGPRLPRNGLARDTDSDGVATFEIPALRTAPGEPGGGAAAPRPATASLDAPAPDTDGCGGQTATEVVARIGDDAGAGEFTACLPVDPDATARVRVSPQAMHAGGHVRVEVARAPEARGLPVVVSLLVREDGGLRAVASQTLDPTQTITEFVVPTDAVGHVVVRARPLYGRELVEVRGGTTSLWVTPGPPVSARVSLQPDATEPSRATLEVSAAARDVVDLSGARAVAVALPLDESRNLWTLMRNWTASPLGDLRRPDGVAGEALLAGALAARTPLDVTAPARLRGRALVPVPAPENPETLGLLRDPWRARARFVGGRLGLLFRAVENAVERAVPGRQQDVATLGPRGFELSELLLESLDEEALGDGGATGLGGEPVSVAALLRLDPAFTYDNVARRITRKRLFRTLMALRQLVRDRSLDLTWARRGDPADWLALLREDEGILNQAYDDEAYEESSAGTELSPGAMLVDGWGTPLALRPAPGGRPRFAQLAPVAGYELVSAGPDRRFGTADDLWDPTARVLPPTGLYQEAVGETALVARLRGVELGRATVETVARVFGVGQDHEDAGPFDEPGARTSESSWDALPSVLRPDPHALALRRPSVPADGASTGSLGMDAAGAIGAGTAVGASRTLELGEEPRTWGTVALVATPHGSAAVALGETVAGSPALRVGDLPPRLRSGERIGVDLVVTSAVDAEARYVVRAHAPDGVRVDVPATLVVPAGESVVLPVALSAERATQGTLSLELLREDGRTVALRLCTELEVDDGLHPLRRRATGLAAPAHPWTSQLRVPDGAHAVEGRVVLLAPNALWLDPDLAEAHRRDPALVAWSAVLSGATLPAELRARLLAAQQPDGSVRGESVPLSTATAALVFASLGADDLNAASAFGRALGALGNAPPVDDRDGDAGVLRAAALRLAALATGGTVDPRDEDVGSRDPVSQLLADGRLQLRRAWRTRAAEPSLLARAAAALLLANPRDGHGLAMLDRVAGALRAHDGGKRVVPSATRGGDDLEALSATLALAVAAHRAGRAELSAELLRGAAGSLPVVARVGGEPLFWWLACGAYGALGGAGTGNEASTAATVEVDGRRTSVTLVGGVGMVRLPGLRPGARVDVRVDVPNGAPTLLSRVEAVYGRAFEAARGPALDLDLQGDLGEAGSLAALELTVTSRVPVERAVVEVQLPSGVRADDALLAALRETSGVRSVEPRAPGFLRVTLARLDAARQVVLPLPLRWTATGELSGLAVVAYPASRPSQMTVLAPRRLRIGAGR